MKIERIGNPSWYAENFVTRLENNKEELKSTGDEMNVLLANFTSATGNEAVNSIRQALDTQESVLFLENVKKEHFPDNTLISVDADYCIVKSAENGRIQHILFSSQSEQGPMYLPEELKNIDATVDEKGNITSIEKEAIHLSQKEIPVHSYFTK